MAKSIVLHRQLSYPNETLGYIKIDNCIIQTLENSKKLIPKGTFPLSFTWSPKFQQTMPLISVPKRVGIRIHSGNTYKDTTGCILVGLSQSNRTISRSRDAYQILVTYLKQHEINSISIV